MTTAAQLRNFASLAVMAALLVGCGGGSGSTGGGDSSGVIVPAPPPPPPPPPAPPPSPPPVSMTPIPGQIFTNPTLTPSLFTVARGWVFDFTGNSTPPTNSQLSEDANATYLAGSSSYQLTIPLLGTNTLYQSYTATDRPEYGGTAYVGTVAASPAAAMNGSDLLVLKPGTGTPYTYVSQIVWYTVQELGANLFRNSYGVLGLAQPTPAGSVPITGTRRYTGTVLAFPERDVGSTVIGTIVIDADFAAGTLSGSVTMKHVCFMGCEYPTIPYSLGNFVYARGATGFTGAMTAAGAPNAGSLSGRFAGPHAQELIIAFRTPYRDPDRNAFVALSGVALGRQ